MWQRRCPTVQGTLCVTVAGTRVSVITGNPVRVCVLITEETSPKHKSPDTKRVLSAPDPMSPGRSP